MGFVAKLDYYTSRVFVETKEAGARLVLKPENVSPAPLVDGAAPAAAGGAPGSAAPAAERSDDAAQVLMGLADTRNSTYAMD